jgi:hypothetical protein
MNNTGYLVTQCDPWKPEDYEWFVTTGKLLHFHGENSLDTEEDFQLVKRPDSDELVPDHYPYTENFYGKAFPKPPQLRLPYAPNW